MSVSFSWLGGSAGKRCPIRVRYVPRTNALTVGHKGALRLRGTTGGEASSVGSEISLVILVEAQLCQEQTALRECEGGGYQTIEIPSQTA